MIKLDIKIKFKTEPNACHSVDSVNGKQVLFGMEDGAIRIHSLDEEYDIATLNYSWQLNMHDNNYGNLTGLKLGYDALSLLTVGADGNFFMYDVMTQENLDKKIAEAKAKLPSAKVSVLCMLV